MAFSAGKAPKVGGYSKGGSDIYGTTEETGYAFDYGSQMQDRGRFEKGRLAQAMTGETSVAQQQLRQGLGQAQQAMAQQAGAQGSNPLAQRAAIMGGAQMQQQANAQSAALRAQEVAAAQDAYSQYQAAAAQGHSVYDQMGQQGSFKQEELMRDWNRHRTEQEAAERAFGMQMAGTAASAMSGLMSDERSKMNISEPSGGAQDALLGSIGKAGGSGGAPAALLGSISQWSEQGGEERESKALDDAMRALKMYQYDYKPEFVAGGLPGERQTGVMAQALESSQLGSQAVRSTPAGKVIDPRESVGLQFGMLGRLDSRLSKLERSK